MTTTITAAAPSRTANTVLWVAQGLIAALFLFGAYGKVLLDPMVVAGFAAMGMGEGMALFVGLCELAGAVGILVPVLSGLAGLGLTALMIGATGLTVAFAGVEAAVFPAAVLLVVAAVTWGRRDRLRALFTR
ncbi:putative membrane protein YphA (DoxX/SURF4 family) [Crossiella equi]|uniref:Membrane protein YphA (DoxX/SURF4 family) n=1 Tax=Crossiella equi TaxID=130796 RepID=A0ABS5AGI7_9PSEU|nr:DoxX family protein [Crossiella equi]MBP2475467.1 putative membrane protein YphA (DoxX/SURF4 family) [Crossiella equi]